MTSIAQNLLVAQLTRSECVYQWTTLAKNFAALLIENQSSRLGTCSCVSAKSAVVLVKKKHSAPLKLETYWSDEARTMV